MTLTPEEAERLFCIARDLLSEPRLADRANKLTAEACHLAGKRQMMTMSALRYLAARGHKEAQGFLDALEVSVCQAAAPQAPQFGWLKVATGFATGTSLGFLRPLARNPGFPGIIGNGLRRESARNTNLSALHNRCFRAFPALTPPHSSYPTRIGAKPFLRSAEPRIDNKPRWTFLAFAMQCPARDG